MTIVALTRVMRVCDYPHTLPTVVPLSFDLVLKNVIGLKWREMRDNEGLQDSSLCSSLDSFGESQETAQGLV